MKGFLRAVPNRPMTRLLILGTALACVAACQHEVNNVGSQDVLCAPTLQLCLTDSECAPGDTCGTNGVCLHCGGASDPLDAALPPPVDGPAAGGDGGDEPCVAPLPLPCSNDQDCVPFFPGTSCDLNAMKCVCPPSTTCTAPVDTMGNPQACLPPNIGCSAEPLAVCDNQTLTCVCP